MLAVLTAFFLMCGTIGGCGSMSQPSGPAGADSVQEGSTGDAGAFGQAQTAGTDWPADPG